MKYLTAALLASILVFNSCKETNSEMLVSPSDVVAPLVEKQGAFMHAVYFWLAEPENTDKNAAFEKSLLKFLKACPYINSYHVGTPASTDREIIDASYTYSLIVNFDDRAEHDKYQEDANHKLFIEESQTLWTKVQIYDSVDILSK